MYRAIVHFPGKILSYLLILSYREVRKLIHRRSSRQLAHYDWLTLIRFGISTLLSASGFILIIWVVRMLMLGFYWFPDSIITLVFILNEKKNPFTRGTTNFEKDFSHIWKLFSGVFSTLIIALCLSIEIKEMHRNKDN